MKMVIINTPFSFSLCKFTVFFICVFENKTIIIFFFLLQLSFYKIQFSLLHQCYKYKFLKKNSKQLKHQTHTHKPISPNEKPKTSPATYKIDAEPKVLVIARKRASRQQRAHSHGEGKRTFTLIIRTTFFLAHRWTLLLERSRRRFLWRTCFYGPALSLSFRLAPDQDRGPGKHTPRPFARDVGVPLLPVCQIILLRHA